MRFPVFPVLPLSLIFVQNAFSQDLPPPSLVSVSSAVVDTVGNTVMSALGVDTSGNACRAGSVGTALSQDRQVLTLIFDDFQANIGPGIPKAQNKRSCTVKISLNVPAGWSYTLANSDYRGFCKLDEKITGIFRTSYTFSGMQSNLAKSQKVIDGPFEDDFLASATGEQKGEPWLSCSLNAVTGGVATLVQTVAQPVTTAVGGVLGGVTGLVNGLTGNLLSGDAAGALVGSLVGTVLTINTQISLLSSDDAGKAKGMIQADSLDSKFKQNFQIKWKRCGK